MKQEFVSKLKKTRSKAIFNFSISYSSNLFLSSSLISKSFNRLPSFETSRRG